MNDGKEGNRKDDKMLGRNAGKEEFRMMAIRMKGGSHLSSVLSAPRGPKTLSDGRYLGGLQTQVDRLAGRGGLGVYVAKGPVRVGPGRGVTL